jgi:hypothetical protein
MDRSYRLPGRLDKPTVNGQSIATLAGLYGGLMALPRPWVFLA